MKLWIKIERPIGAEADIPLKNEASEKIKALYNAEHKDEFIFWLDEEEGTMGCIKNNRSISMCCKKVSALELQEMKPSKGRGYVSLSFMTSQGEEVGSICSNQCSKNALEWLASIQPIIANEADLESRYSDHGYDA